LKIDQHLAKLWAIKYRVIFMKLGVVVIRLHAYVCANSIDRR